MNKTISDLHIVGYGGLGKEVIFLLNAKFPHINIIPYDDFSKDKKVLKIEVLKSINQPVDCLIAIGDGELKENIYNLLCKNKNISFPNIILSNFENYNFSDKNKIGIGNLLMPQTIIGYNSNIGNFNLFGVNSGVGHDATIGSFNFIGPNCFLAGNVKIENSCKLSFGTFILQKVSLVSNINTMPYTTIYKNLKIAGSYHGNPSKKI